MRTTRYNASDRSSMPSPCHPRRNLRRRQALHAPGKVPTEALESRLLMSRDLYVDIASPNPAGDGSSWANAYADLQQALAAATSGDHIRIADGTYTPTATASRAISFALKEGVSLLGGYAGYGAADPNARNGTLYPTILSGDIGTADSNADNSYHVVTATGVTSATVLDTLVISAGNADGMGGLTTLDGGGMYNTLGASPTLTNCTFTRNSATHYGGGMYNSSASPILNGTTFSTNSAASYGGGMYNLLSSPALNNVAFSTNSASRGAGMYDDSSSPILIGCTFSGNSVNSYGGGMCNTSSAPTLRDTAFSGNSAMTRGGGMYNEQASSPTLDNCTFTANTASTGGGMYNLFLSSPTLSNSTFSGNSADTYGGGMANQRSSPRLTNTTFTANSAKLMGGGIYSIFEGPTLTDCSLTGNSAGQDGGGMYNEMATKSSTSPQVILTNTTFTGNSAGRSGGGMHNVGTSPTLRNTIFVANSAAVDGGGMYNIGASSPIVTNGYFLGNSAAVHGGAVYSETSWPVLVNTIFVGNSAKQGGALYNYTFITDSTKLVLTNCTFTANAATLGGAVYNLRVSPDLTNCILWDNGDTPVYNDSGILSITYSTVQGGYSGTANLNADPLFVRNPSAGADAKWGTADDDRGDLRLQPGSPCIDTGNSTASGLSGTTTDFRGALRVVSASVDMGAYEFDPPPAVSSVTINDGAIQRSMVKKLSITFSEPVTLSSDALAVKLSTGQAIAGTVTAASTDQQTYTLTFSGTGVVGGSLADGIYDLVISPAGIQDLAGNPLTASYTKRFHRLYGDMDGNKVVNIGDYAKFKATFGRSSSDPLFSSALDYDNNNVINIGDYAQFKKRFGIIYSY